MFLLLFPPTQENESCAQFCFSCYHVRNPGPRKIELNCPRSQCKVLLKLVQIRLQKKLCRLIVVISLSLSEKCIVIVECDDASSILLDIV